MNQKNKIRNILVTLELVLLSSPLDPRGQQITMRSRCGRGHNPPDTPTWPQDTSCVWLAWPVLIVVGSQVDQDRLHSQLQVGPFSWLLLLCWTLKFTSTLHVDCFVVLDLMFTSVLHAGSFVVLDTNFTPVVHCLFEFQLPLHIYCNLLPIFFFSQRWMKRTV